MKKGSKLSISDWIVFLHGKFSYHANIVIYWVIVMIMLAQIVISYIPIFYPDPTDRLTYIFCFIVIESSIVLLAIIPQVMSMRKINNILSKIMNGELDTPSKIEKAYLNNKHLLF